MAELLHHPQQEAEANYAQGLQELTDRYTEMGVGSREFRAFGDVLRMTLYGTSKDILEMRRDRNGDSSGEIGRAIEKFGYGLTTAQMIKDSHEEAIPRYDVDYYQPELERVRAVISQAPYKDTTPTAISDVPLSFTKIMIDLEGIRLSVLGSGNNTPS